MKTRPPVFPVAGERESRRMERACGAGRSNGESRFVLSGTLAIPARRIRRTAAGFGGLLAGGVQGGRGAAWRAAHNLSGLRRGTPKEARQWFHFLVPDWRRRRQESEKTRRQYFSLADQFSLRPAFFLSFFFFPRG